MKIRGIDEAAIITILTNIGYILFLKHLVIGL